MPRTPLLVALAILVLTGGCRRAPVGVAPQAAPGQMSDTAVSRLYTVSGFRVLTLAGTPEEMGRAHGEMLREDVRWTVEKVVRETIARDPEVREDFLKRVDVMERHLKDSWRRELKALAAAAGVDYRELVALQLFGDVERAPGCSSFAVFGRATADGECIVGRNFDYWYEEVAKRSSIVIDYHPHDARRFVTLSWTGVVNGWTLMNDCGIVTANNTSYSGGDNASSLEGVSTCFMLRAIAEEARTIDEGVKIVEKSAKACPTNLIVAGGSPPGAAVVEYDHARLLVRRAKEDFILATNSFVELGQEKPDEPVYGRYGVLRELVRGNYGKIDRSMNFAAAAGVPIESINLHSALLFPRDLSFRAAMGTVPACCGTWGYFRMTPAGIEPVEH